ncbi:hypothetical protein J422_06563 [Methanocaldococcus villosus KIN24-T80]|uniref:DUF112 domain-containing protein n=1 Tax=Methanocaldococcus villosus KIN24-T80 TaxID=1069083 RepID=N6VR95_9EURY|nr:tripartite tricarboxylate transporter permease [Methanocaldococcus villosus]ENN95671.1 hypothetical protein J422_06563 [Methanocaldococcus villosus KIN24-T80]
MIYLILGIICGIFTGLFPGIHPNNIAALSFLLYPYFGEHFINFLIGLVVTHYFINFIPAAFLGIPDDETAVSVLPMHRLSIIGEGFKAILLSGIGSYLGVLFSLLISFLIIFLKLNINYIFSNIKPFIPYILILFVIYQIISAKNVWEVLVILLSGLFGIAVLYYHTSYNITLTAIFTGMYGIPILLNNLNSKFKKQRITYPNFSLKYIKITFFASLIGFFRIFLPAIGGAQLNYFLSKIIRENEIESFLVSQGAIVLSNEIFSLLALVFIGTGRSGVANTIKELNLNFSLDQLSLSIILSATLAFIILIYLSKFILSILERVNIRVLSILLIFICTLIIIVGSYNFGVVYHLIVYFSSVFLGLLAVRSGSNLTNLMNVLVFPTILIYLGD